MLLRLRLPQQTQRGQKAFCFAVRRALRKKKCGVAGSGGLTSRKWQRTHGSVKNMTSSGPASPKRQVFGTSYSNFLTCLGVGSPILLSPLLFEGSKASRCGFCISTVSILLLTETLPAPITALLPLFVFTDLGLGDPACLHVLSGTLLVVLVDVMMVFLLCLTSVYQRVSLWLLDVFGARLRSVALICMSAALLAPLILHDTLAALLVLSLVRRLVADYMNDNVQSYMVQQERESQRKQLLQTMRQKSSLADAGGTITSSDVGSPMTPPTLMMSLGPIAAPQAEAQATALRQPLKDGKEEIVITSWRENATERTLSPQDVNELSDPVRQISTPVDKAPPSAVPLMSATILPSTSSERAAQNVITSPTQLPHSPSRKSSLESELFSEELAQLCSRPRPHTSSLSTAALKRGIKKTRKRTSIMEGGKIVMPGASSPPPKVTASTSDEMSSFLYGTRRPVREYIGFKYQKQQMIHRQLAVTTVIACTLTSAMSLSRNRANVYFLDYFRDRFNAEVTSHLVWMAMVLPMECVTLMVAWLHVRAFVLRQFDVELDKNTQINIQLFLQKKRHGMERIGCSECLSVLLFSAWTVIHSVTHRHTGLRTTTDDMHPLGVLCLVLAYAPPFTKWLHGVFMNFEGIVQRLPWGAIITVAGSDAIMLIIKVSGFTQWLSTQLQRYAPSQLVMQCVLALCSSLLTELAVTTPCNPLYFAIPVTVAASTSLVLPTSGVSLAVLTNLIDVGPVQLLVMGLTLKSIALLMILLTVNLNADYHRLPHWIFTERRNHTTTTMF
ncbi:uncharacterized protein [Dermacentor albipictus]|uniref:uncharacterized protein isoform X2 n=1 Tax=Dermacentor albipictus TaxID=60249 RepID=UPI0038FBEE74